jgi:CDP-diacylglycerol--glycerol-3-phosphate 3-phosphatidyltransferase
MATIYDLKPAFQRVLRPCAGALVRLGAKPNAITLAALMLSFLAGAAIAIWPHARWPYLALPIVLFARMALNAIDGIMAREHDLASPFGAILNELGDVASDAALYLPFALVLTGSGPGLVVAIVVLGSLGELAGVLAQVIGASRRYDGPLGKSDRAFVFGALALALGLGVPPGLWTELLLAILAVLAGLTIVNRIAKSLKETGS